MTEALLNDLGDLGLDPDARPPPIQVEAPPSPPPDEFTLMPELQAPPTEASTTLSPPATPTPPKSPTMFSRPPRQSGKIHSELKEPPRSRNPSGEVRVSSVSSLMNSGEIFSKCVREIRVIGLGRPTIKKKKQTPLFSIKGCCSVAVFFYLDSSDVWMSTI